MAFLSNKPLQTRAEYAAKLTRLGVPAAPDDVINSSLVLARYTDYPRLAQMQGWQGAVTMRLRVAPSGRLLDAEVYASSGHEVLDRQALAMAARAERFPAPPEGLRDREVAVLVPVVFRLER